MRQFDSFLKEKRRGGEKIIVFKRVEGSCGKGVICFLCLPRTGLKLQCKRFNLGTRENLLAAGVVKHGEPSLRQRRFSLTGWEWFRWL